MTDKADKGDPMQLASQVFRQAVRRNDHPRSMAQLRQYDLQKVADYIDRLEIQAIEFRGKGDGA